MSEKELALLEDQRDQVLEEKNLVLSELSELKARTSLDPRQSDRLAELRLLSQSLQERLGEINQDIKKVNVKNHNGVQRHLRTILRRELGEDVFDEYLAQAHEAYDAETDGQSS